MLVRAYYRHEVVLARTAVDRNWRRSRVMSFMKSTRTDVGPKGLSMDWRGRWLWKPSDQGRGRSLGIKRKRRIVNQGGPDGLPVSVIC